MLSSQFPVNEAFLNGSCFEALACSKVEGHTCKKEASLSIGRFFFLTILKNCCKKDQPSEELVIMGHVFF